MDDLAVTAFTAAHTERRIRGAFRLAGTVLTVALAFVLSLAALQAYHEAIVIVIPVPFAVCWLAGELAVAIRRARRAPPIPLARVVSGGRVLSAGASARPAITSEQPDAFTLSSHPNPHVDPAPPR